MLRSNKTHHTHLCQHLWISMVFFFRQTPGFLTFQGSPPQQGSMVDSRVSGSASETPPSAMTSLRRDPVTNFFRGKMRQNEAKWFFSWNSRLSPFFSEFSLYSLEVFSMPETSSFPWVNHEISGVDNFSLNFTLSNIVWLVEPTPLKNMSQLGLLFPIYGKKSKPPTSCPFLGDTWW